ncbi:MAG TPA: hypothetical protein VFA94_00545 [Acidimicrobiales bacterium]|nr:hypothetical protein [Acidimicrobiales bacterium]
MTPRGRMLAALAAGAVALGAAGPVLAAGRPPAGGGGGGGGVVVPVPVPPVAAGGGAGAFNILMTPAVPFTAIGGANEDPTMPGAPAAVPLFRFARGVLSVALTSLDPARYPAGAVAGGRGAVAAAGPCNATITINGTTKSLISPLPSVAPAVGNQVGFRIPAAASAGATSHIDLVCNFIDPKAGLQHHETHWKGTMP